MSIADNIAQVEEEIAAACRKASRPRNSVQLMAVSKMHPSEAILKAYAAGIRLFGENRVQEYAGKRAALEAAGIFSAQPSANFHLIGPLQSNKISRAAALFDAVDAVDSLRLAERLDQVVGETGKRLSALIEIKLSPESSKHGLEPESPEIEELFERLPDLAHLHTRGLMTVPPYAENPEEARLYFQRLRALRDSLAQRYPHVTLDELSMGMSHDFPVAIEEGATLIRVGTAIFGTRVAG